MAGAKDLLLQCNAGEVDVCDKCRAHNKQCIVLSVTCEEVIRSYHFEPENMSFDELWNLIQGLVQNGDLNHSDPPHILSNYQTLNPTAPMRVVPTPFPPSPLSPSYTTIQPNPSQHMPSYHIPRVNQPPHAYSTVIPGHSNSRTTENLRALGVPGVNHYPPASFSGASMRHGNYPTHAGQGILPFGGQANHLPYGDQMPRGYP